MSIHDNETNSANSTNVFANMFARDEYGDFSLSMELCLAVGVVFIGSIAMIFMVYMIEQKKGRKRARKVLDCKE
jgi:hypothetical protein